MSTYTIQHLVYEPNVWEPLDNGEFDTLEGAQAAMAELERDLGWTGMRIVEDDGTVVEYGTPDPESADEDEAA